MNSVMAELPVQNKASRALDFVGIFNLWMAGATAILLLASLVGCALTGIEIPDLRNWAIVSVILLAMLLPIPAYWYEKGRANWLDTTLTLLWALLQRLIIPLLVRVAARLRFPLQDSLLGRIDLHLGISVPAIMAWANHHWLGEALNRSYGWVVILLPIAVILPVVAHRSKYTKELIAANFISFAIGIPLFALLPAVGPWRYFNFAPTQPQLAFCEIPLMDLRLPGQYILGSQDAGIVCFPSFHVVWALFFASTLWGFRWLRIPVVVVSAMVILSTLTTGWHYFADVLGGVVIAIISIRLAKMFMSRLDAEQPTRADRFVPEHGR